MAAPLCVVRLEIPAAMVTVGLSRSFQNVCSKWARGFHSGVSLTLFITPRSKFVVVKLGKKRGIFCILSSHSVLLDEGGAEDDAPREVGGGAPSGVHQAAPRDGARVGECVLFSWLHSSYKVV